MINNRKMKVILVSSFASIHNLRFHDLGSAMVTDRTLRPGSLHRQQHQPRAICGVLVGGDVSPRCCGSWLQVPEDGKPLGPADTNVDIPPDIPEHDGHHGQHLQGANTSHILAFFP